MSRLIYILCLLACFTWAEAQGTSSKRVRSLQQKRGELSKKIAETSKALRAVEQKKQAESERLKLKQQQVAQRQEMISLIGQEMQSLQGQIDTLGGRLASLRNREQRLSEEYATSLRSVYRGEARRTRQHLLYLFSAESLSQLNQRQRLLKQYSRATGKVLAELISTRTEIENTQKELSHIHQSKAEVLQLREREREALEREQGVHTQNLNKLKVEERKLSQDLDKQKRQAGQLDAQIQAQIAAEIAVAEAKAKREREAREARQRRRDATRRRAEERRKAEIEARRRGTKPSQGVDQRGQSKPQPKDEDKEESKPEAQPKEQDDSEEKNERRAEVRGGYAMDASERKLSGSFAQNKGKLPMPVRGRYGLVHRFGTQQHEQHSRISISRSGIDLRVYGDRNAYAVFDGVVSNVFVTDGYMQCVILKHGNYFTVYSNLSSVKVRSGQKVTAGAVVGSINSDDSNGRGNMLHFQLWHDRRKQNPEAWLRR